MVPLEHLSRFWRNLEISLITCEVNVFLTWSEKCIMVEIMDMKLWQKLWRGKTKICNN